MKNNSKLLCFTVIILLWYGFCLFAVLYITGCLEAMPNGNPGFTNPVAFGPEWLDAILEIAQAMSMANYASTPLNPYAWPIGIGLAGITAMVEALRRKEKSARKYAEHELKSNGNNSSKS